MMDCRKANRKKKKEEMFYREGIGLGKEAERERVMVVGG